MESIKRALKFQGRDFQKSVGMFWLVLFIVNIGSYVSMYKFNRGFIGIRVSGYASIDGIDITLISVAAANLVPIIIFFIVYCYEMYYEYFPVAISFSVTRKDFYKSAVIYNLITSAVFALIQGILIKADLHLVQYLGQNIKSDFGIFNSGTDSIIFIVFSLFICFTVFASAMNLLSALNYKFGYRLWIVIALLGIPYSARMGIPFELVGRLFTERIGAAQFSILAITAFACFVAGFLTVSGTNVKDRL